MSLYPGNAGYGGEDDTNVALAFLMRKTNKSIDCGACYKRKITDKGFAINYIYRYILL